MQTNRPPHIKTTTKAPPIKPFENLLLFGKQFAIQNRQLILFTMRRVRELEEPKICHKFFSLVLSVVRPNLQADFNKIFSTKFYSTKFH